jgi:A/G-specific adenine glycosylase
MLQQTAVKTVIPYYLRWLAEFPTVCELAGSKEREVLLLWEGLGYYNRARNLHRSAKQIVEKYDGSLPSDYHSLTELPGIGDYTARAILSISYGKPYPVVDANIRRIGQRLQAWPHWEREQAKLLESTLRRLIPLDDPGRFNEALMELGQTVCLRSHPSCSRCPLSSCCLAFTENKQNTIPAASHAAAIPRVSRRILLLRQQDSRRTLEIWMTKSPAGLLEGLWLFPLFSSLEAINQSVRPTGSDTGSGNHFFKEIGNLPSRIHSYTRYREELRPAVYLLSKRSPCSEAAATSTKRDALSPGQWVPLEDIRRYPMPSVYRRIVSDLMEMLENDGSFLLAEKGQLNGYQR